MTPPGPGRRDFFSWSARGLGAAALLHLLGREAAADERKPHFAAKAKRVTHVCLIGGLSHVDSFDPKPELGKMHSQSLNSKEAPDIFFGQIGRLRKPDWAFKPRG